VSRNCPFLGRNSPAIIPKFERILFLACWQAGRDYNEIKEDVLNDERLWSKYYQLSILQSFQDTWEKYLSSNNLKKEPMLYQHVTDELFDLLKKENVSKNFNLQANLAQETDVPLSFEEENTVHYIGGYLVRKVHDTCNDGVKAMLGELTADGNVISADSYDLDKLGSTLLTEVDL